jgi:hypothetical protein
MGGNITKTALGKMTLSAKKKYEMYADTIVTTAKDRIIEQGGDGGTDVRLGFYKPPVPNKK